MIDLSDIAFLIVLFLLVGGVIHGLLTAKDRRLENMDDSDPFDDAEWRFGTPDDPIRDVAHATCPHGTSEGACSICNPDPCG